MPAVANNGPTIITGASGLLGRAVLAAFQAAGHEVKGTCFSRPSDTLIQLDLTDEPATTTFLTSLTPPPRAIIHCAAERRPDVAAADPDLVRRLNVRAVAALAALARRLGAWFLYVSTDYVFDGRNPPYDVDAVTRPLNLYGETKRAGELAALQELPQSAVLRVPILYGPAEKHEESAVNVLISVVLNSSAKVKMDDYQKRFPTNVQDVARVIKDMYELEVSGKTEVSGIFHYTAEQQMTKFQMCEVFARVLGASIDHLERVGEPPKDPVATRPDDCHLSTRRLRDELGVDVSHRDFEAWWRAELGGARL
ncbi:NAD dependent epimerase/dehydratase [Zopfochytrium polystomum]|nr:NAD dependent epimerase/dehydratase [Zopfochytrium polystomum]